MNELKQGDKVLVEAELERIDDDGQWGHVTIGYHRFYTQSKRIHRDLTKELERLRAYVELQPCMCQRGLVKLCDRCKALGKEKS